MLDKETRAHDLALSFVSYTLDLEREGTDAEHDEGAFFDMYMRSLEKFREYLADSL